MLYELYVENFAIIGQMRLQLGKGLNALTGETGAGKSLVIDAVALLIGGRGSDSFIRSGFERCVIEGVFTRPFSLELMQALRELGQIPDDEDDTLILSRELLRGGRGNCRVNGRAVNLGQLRTLGRMLLNIHGQMEHMLLLEEEQQLRLLDSYGGSALLQIKMRVEEAYALMREKQQLYDNFNQHKTARQERMALLATQIEELETAVLKPNEEEELRRESRRLDQAEKLLALTDEAQRELGGSPGATESLSAAVATLKQITRLDDQAQALADRVESLYYEAEDMLRELEHYAANICADAYRLDELESRLALLSRLKKKYGGESAQLLEYLQKARAELKALDDLDYSGGKAHQVLQEAQTAYDIAAGELSAARIAAALQLSTAINEELQLLCMSQALFRINLPSSAPTAQGREKALFIIRTNEGEEFRPVARIASGGELSRIVLAMKVILAQLDSVPTLIFDEVDSGLGGRALNAVAQRLAYVGQSTQAIVVTHAPVMAASASRQLHISKQVTDGRTEITALELKGQERVDELARMIAGDNISVTTRNQAREMLKIKSERRP